MALNERGVEKICDFKPIRLSETGHAICHPLVSVKETSLPGWVSLGFVRIRLSNMHRCCAFPFALAGLFLLNTIKYRQRQCNR